jgi:general secretion pathway protein G
MRALPTALGTLAVSFAGLVALEIASPMVSHGPESRYYATRADLRNLHQAVLLFQRQRGSPPSSLEQLVQFGLLERLPADPWGNSYAYQQNGHGSNFFLYSPGADAMDQRGEGDDIAELEKGSECELYRANCLEPQLANTARLASALLFVLSAAASIGLLIHAIWRWGVAKRAT